MSVFTANNGHAPAIEDVDAVIEWLNERLDLEVKANVLKPGSRGGKYYIDDKGIVRYGTKPVGGGAKKRGKGRGAKKDPAQAEAERKQREAMRQAKANARDEVRDIDSGEAAKKLGYAMVGAVSGDVAALNQAARDAGTKDPSKIYAVVKVGEGQYQVISKPLDALKGDRSNALTRNAGADRAAAQRQQERAQAQSDRTQRQQLQRAERDKQRQQRQRERETARIGREQQRAQDRARREAERANKKRKEAISGVQYKEAARNQPEKLLRALEADLETEFRDTYEAYAQDHDYDFSEHESEVKALLREYYPELFAVAYEDAADVHGLKVAFDARNPEVEKVINEIVGDRVKGIAATTRQTLKDLVFTATESGMGPAQLARLIMEHSVTDSKSRAEMIARSETATAYNVGAIRSYKDAGVERVEVLDGDGDAECAAAHGQTWSLEKALGSPIAHPNCVRSFAPIVGAGE